MFFSLVLGSTIPPVFGLITITLVLLGIAYHEFSHAYIASKLGDSTPRLAGRLTLNPLAHLDLLGTIMMLVSFFGWGKPTPVNPFEFRNLRRDFAITAIAGPLSNLIFAGILILSLRFSSFFLTGATLIYFQYAVIQAVLIIGVNLVVFNLIPIAPLDGERILMFLLPEHIRSRVEPFMTKFGLFIVILMILPILPGGHSVLSHIILPLHTLVINMITPLIA